MVEDALRHGELVLGADIADVLAVLKAVDVQQGTVGAAVGGIVEDERQRDVVLVSGQVEGQRGGEVGDAGVVDAFKR